MVDAQSNGRDALERLQTQQVRQLADGLGTRVSQITDSFLATLPVTFEANSEADSATLTRSLSAFGGSTGAYLVEHIGR